MLERTDDWLNGEGLYRAERRLSGKRLRPCGASARRNGDLSRTYDARAVLSGGVDVDRLPVRAAVGGAARDRQVESRILKRDLNIFAPETRP